MTTVKYPLGSIPSPLDMRDFPLASAPRFKVAQQTVFPASFTLPGGIPAPLDQDGGKCVAFSSIGVKNYQEHLQLGQWLYDDNSADALYAQCKAIDGIPDIEGTYPRVALNILQTVGATAINGHHYLIGPYYTLLDGNPVESNIKTSLVYYKRPVLIALHWFNSWYSLGPNATVPTPSGGIPGDHEMWIWGYATTIAGKTLWRIEQSWGDGWGNKGRFYLPNDYVVDPACGVSDLWVTIDR